MEDKNLKEASSLNTIKPEQFEEIGLKKNHANVYLTLLKFGKLNMHDIVKKTGIQRSYVYDILDELSEKGLIGNYVKEKSKLYFADDPKKIIDIIDKKSKQIDSFKDDFEKILPSLLLRNNINNEFNLLTYEGKNGIKNILEDIVKEEKDFFCFGTEGQFSKHFPVYINKFISKLKEKKIKYKIIYSSGAKENHPPMEKGAREIRYLPKKYQNSFVIIIYGNNVGLVAWNSMTSILIKNKEIASGFLNYFNLMWKIAKK